MTAVARMIAEMTAQGSEADRGHGIAGPSLSALEHVSNLVCICVDGRIVYANPAAARVLGVAQPEALLGCMFSEFLDKEYGDILDSQPEIFALERKSLRLKLRPLAGKRPSLDLNFRRLDGRTYLIEGQDVSEYIRASVAARKREMRLRRILDAAGEAIVAFDEGGRIEMFNPAAERMFGITRSAAFGSSVVHLLPDPFADARGRAMLAGEPGTGELSGTPFECDGHRSDGSGFPMEMMVTALPEGRHRLLIAVIRDITERKREQARIQRLAHYDNLTELPNRNLFYERLDRALRRALRAQTHVALMFVDLDRFKVVNDTHGHDAGDLLLRNVAARLTECIRATDTLARVGGDEFVVLLEDLEEGGSAGVVAQKIIDIMGEPFDIAGHPFTIGASVGISLYPTDTTEPEELITLADDAMYRAKARGRNAFLFARP